MNLSVKLLAEARPAHLSLLVSISGGHTGVSFVAQSTLSYR